MSSSQDTPASTSKRQKAPPIPFATWPTIKILNPPQGRFSPRTDERCFMYCSQTVAGRFHRKEPYCKAICIRKVFTHEVRNIVSFRTHHNLDADGKAKYPLPKEGQPGNLPPYLGGTDPEGTESDDHVRKPGDDKKYWDEGWYLWYTKSSQGVWEKVWTMRRDLESQQQYEAAKDKRRDDWAEYQDYQKEPKATAVDSPAPDKWWGPIVPPPPILDISAESLLISLPPPLPPLYSKVENLLAPTHKLLGILHESVTSGAQQELVHRIWEKAWTKDPYVLASRAFGLLWEKWSSPPDDSDDQKKPT
ncbi:hypothetical protein BDN71DRAFT_1438440 [Pleurotus eryngii]|uniref:Uncharacterized protein n=1 Tax=Pleurotus eryngii TaxID=5323 RepID=A0A9P6DCK8_PLEER|nr:hypothetical protein BDN71DRAFT_1438440 [Pleurotus eryngii]